MGGPVRRLLDALAGAAALAGAIACGASSEIHELPEGARIVDVRSATEYQAGHFPGAVNIPVTEIAGRTAELGDKDGPIVVYCRSGHRSAAAKSLLDKAGFTNVTDGGALSGMMRLAPQP